MFTSLQPNFLLRKYTGLTSQIKRSSISVPSNVAEGAGRNSNKEFVHFLSYSQRSSYELETQLILANDLDFLSRNELQPVFDKLHEIQKMNRSFQQRLIQRK